MSIMRIQRFLNRSYVDLSKEGVTKHSIVMPDRAAGGFLFFIYQMVTPANFQFEE